MMISSWKNISRLLCGTALCYCTALFPTGLIAQPSSVSAAQIKRLQYLADFSSDNRNPAVAYSPDGKSLFVTWDGLVNGNRRILVRERLAGEWLPTVILDNNPAGRNDFPSVAIDYNGIPHIAWISTIQGKRRPVYARRISRFPNAWHHQTIPFPGETTGSGNCDFLSLRLDDKGFPWLAWQYGYGSISNILVSHFTENGDVISDELTPGASTLNLEPALFFAPQPTVYWYVSQSDQFYLVGSKYNYSTSDWQLSPPDDLDNLPADSLPDLFQTATGPLAAIWYDRLETEGESDGTLADHVFLGLQDSVSKGRGEAIDQQIGFDYHSVSGQNHSGYFVTAWVSESYPEGEQVIAGIGSSPANMQTYKISESALGHSNPKVAVSNKEAIVTWEELTANGKQQISVRSLRLP